MWAECYILFRLLLGCGFTVQTCFGHPSSPPVSSEQSLLSPPAHQRIFPHGVHIAPCFHPSCFAIANSLYRPANITIRLNNIFISARPPDHLSGNPYSSAISSSVPSVIFIFFLFCFLISSSILCPMFGLHQHCLKHSDKSILLFIQRPCRVVDFGVQHPDYGKQAVYPLIRRLPGGGLLRQTLPSSSWMRAACCEFS